MTHRNWPLQRPLPRGYGRTGGVWPRTVGMSLAWGHGICETDGRTPRLQTRDAALFRNTAGAREDAVELHPLVRLEWREEHALSRRSLVWIHEHADPRDVHPVATAIAQLRAERVDRLMEVST